MKRRAGLIGSRGVADVLRSLRERQLSVEKIARMHLIGHSFGGKLLSAALIKVGEAKLKVDSLAILQGTMSHFAFAPEREVKDLYFGSSPIAEGIFANIIRQQLVRGPIVFTHSIKDVPNAYWYPMGVGARGDSLEKVSERPPLFQSVGASGVHRINAGTTSIRNAQIATHLKRNKVLNVASDSILTEHSDIFQPEFYNLILSATDLSER